MCIFNCIKLALLLGFWKAYYTVNAFGNPCNGPDCVLNPVPICPVNGIYSEQENGCIITEPIIKTCPDGFKSTSGTQCSKNVHTEKILACPENSIYNKQKRGCYIGRKEKPECRAGFIEDGDGNCYRLRDAEITCNENEEEREDGCYIYRFVKKRYNCEEIPSNIRLIHEKDAYSYSSSIASLYGEPEYKDDGSANSICKVKIFHKPICPVDSFENKKGSCTKETKPEIFCLKDYVLKDQVQENHQSHFSFVENRYYCQKNEYTEAISECPKGMSKQKDETGIEFCSLYENEIPQICPIGFTYLDTIKKCIRKKSPHTSCNEDYTYKNGLCYLSEVKKIEISPIAFCSDPEATIVGQYCVRNQNIMPTFNCPTGYFLSENNQCIKEIEIEPLATCPPRYILNSQTQNCERKIEKDCSTTQYKKQCTTYNTETDTNVLLKPHNINRNIHHHSHHHSHHHEHPPVIHERNQIVHQCVEIPEHIPKTCVNTEIAPVVYICHDGTQSSDRKKCIKVTSVSPISTCPQEFKQINGICEQQKIESIQYKCSENFILSKNKSNLPTCIPIQQDVRPKTIEAYYECPNNMELNLNELNQYECIEERKPECKSIDCKHLLKIKTPEWKCPLGSELYQEEISNRKLIASNHNKYNSNKNYIATSLPSSISIPKCVIKIVKAVEMRCSSNNAYLQDGLCIETIDKSCPEEGCESFMEFKPRVKCPINTESQGLHNADLCKETIKNPFKYKCREGGTITMHNKCRYIENKKCKYPDCLEEIFVEGKMQCPPGYSEIRHFANNSNFASTQDLNGFTQKRKLFGLVRPLSNIGQCAALEFAPYILSCQQGFTETDGKCLGVVDPSYQCPNGTYMREDGLCNKMASHQTQNARKNKF